MTTIGPPYRSRIPEAEDSTTLLRAWDLLHRGAMRAGLSGPEKVLKYIIECQLTWNQARCTHPDYALSVYVRRPISKGLGIQCIVCRKALS
jgi:hypothetical protein